MPPWTTDSFQTFKGKVGETLQYAWDGIYAVFASDYTKFPAKNMTSRPAIINEPNFLGGIFQKMQATATQTRASGDVNVVGLSVAILGGAVAAWLILRGKK